jgi:hypothetical protein
LELCQKQAGTVGGIGGSWCEFTLVRLNEGDPPTDSACRVINRQTANFELVMEDINDRNNLLVLISFRVQFVREHVALREAKHQVLGLTFLIPENFVARNIVRLLDARVMPSRISCHLVGVVCSV